MEQTKYPESEDPLLISLRESGRCDIPIDTGRPDISFVELLDQARSHANDLASQLGIKVSSNVRWFESTGHYLEVWNANPQLKDEK